MKQKIYAVCKNNKILSRFLAGLCCVRYLVNREKRMAFERERQLYDPEAGRKNVKLVYDIYFSRLKYGINMYEYFIFDFPDKSDAARAQYVSEQELVEVSDKYTGDNFALFRNKYLTYKRFEKYYKRECIMIEKKEDFSIFQAFVNQYKKIVVKAINKSKGIDNYIFDFNDNDLRMEDAFEQILEIGTCIVEEFIIQDRRLADFHPVSVNTVRFTTGICNKKCIGLFAYVRMGIGNSHIDNVCAGGLYAVIDLDTGIIRSGGYKQNKMSGEELLIHPDTGRKIIGYQIPEWDSLIALVNELANSIPEQKLVGWDFALSDKGWVMVEGNTRPSLECIQVEMKCGFRREFEMIFG